ncbi:ribosome maturation factor RimM [Arcobacter sp. FWKO B]|uniref:ribosome maturation factor RimM n=1 Tax=Arcobacter sp. FWKO B TaxID=2593672 RepID=UPI0018A40E31|nr:ribosome maturation factor RimM [Arcobacter sp. FWKO B]QOG12556.1 16S rRNA processing protein RimM [Arcobacter sp. FWKO B]
MNKVYLGKLGKTVGLNGLVKIYLDTDFPTQIKKGTILQTNKKIELCVEKFDLDKSTIKFNSYDDCDSAKKLTNLELYTTIENTKDSIKLKENEFFWFDILGCNIYENDILLGNVVEIHRFPLHDYLEITVTEDLQKKGLPKVFLIPYIKDEYILKVDTSLKTIEVQNSYQILENS